MGFVLCILYFVTYYLTPRTLFGPLAAYRIELILAGLLFFASLPALRKSFILKTTQSGALVGLTFAVFLSVLIGVRWAGGGVAALLAFIPNGLAYFLVCLHCNTRRRLQILVGMLLFVCLFVIWQGTRDLMSGLPETAHQMEDQAYRTRVEVWDIEHPYIHAQSNDVEEPYRIRGLGEINDPNDLGQLIVCVIPLVFIFWRARRMLRNFVCVVLPVCALLFGAYETHSRGALLSLMAVMIVAARRRFGTFFALFLGVAGFAGAMALQFTGGRAISASAGSDRTALWSDSMEMLKANPLFGVGYGGLPEHIGLTAHNSVMVCAAELGVVGLYFWCLFLFPTVRDALFLASVSHVNEGEPITEEAGLYPQAAKKIEDIDKAEINRLGHLIVLSLTGFLVASWFLSRAFVMTLFLLGGMVEVVYQIALQRGMIAQRMQLKRLLLYAAGLGFSLVLAMYILLRTVHLMH
jgi:O-antigen ligase